MWSQFLINWQSWFKYVCLLPLTQLSVQKFSASLRSWAFFFSYIARHVHWRSVTYFKIQLCPSFKWILNNQAKRGRTTGFTDQGEPRYHHIKTNLELLGPPWLCPKWKENEQVKTKKKTPAKMTTCRGLLMFWWHNVAFSFNIFNSFLWILFYFIFCS